MATNENRAASEANEPLELMYSIPVAAELIPFASKQALLNWLFKHKDEFPARYRNMGGCQYRMLYVSEIKAIRARLMSTERVAGRRPRSDRIGPIEAIMRRAMST